MEKFIDRFANWLFTACGIFIVIVVVGQIIDNLRVAINMTLIMIVFLFSGCIVYESISYVNRKIKYLNGNTRYFNKVFYVQRYYDLPNEEFIWRFWIVGFYFDTGKKYIEEE